MNLIKEIHNYLADDIAKMNAIVADNLAVEEELIRLITKHLTSSSGKRIRPVLTILSAKMFNYQKQDDIKLAVAIEFIHLATLLHDDVIDGSKMRRFLPSANTIWGSRASILVGDFLFSQSFKLMVETKSLEALEILSHSSAIIVEGEVSQLAAVEEHKFITEDQYLQIIQAKTACLFAAACEVGAIIAEESSEYQQHLKNFGLGLGTIFQIVDDMLDYFGNKEKIGKDIGEDFYEGKVTLPIILLARKLPANDNEALKRIMSAKSRTKEDFTLVTNLLKHHKIKDDILSYLEKLKNSTIKSIELINVQNQPKKYLRDLVDFAINRSY